MFTQARIDTLYSALDKLRSINDDIFSSLADMPFADPDDPDGSVWANKKGVLELCRFSEIINNAADFASNAISQLEAEDN